MKHIMLVEASRHLGTPANYLSMIRNPTQWLRCPKSGWEAVYQWYNSGQKLSEFSVQHGAVSPRQAEELKPEVFIQFQGQEAVVADVIEKAKKQFEAEGHRASSIKSIQVYLKPEEYAAYYVINQKHAGRVDLF